MLSRTDAEGGAKTEKSRERVTTGVGEWKCHLTLFISPRLAGDESGGVHSHLFVERSTEKQLNAMCEESAGREQGRGYLTNSAPLTIADRSIEIDAKR